ncbi:MAG: hypothetical protein U1B84_21930 [Variovorax sp.]|jgi:hypothetical protein|nr:hypothetical protein [Variovorax sp.]
MNHPKELVEAYLAASDGRGFIKSWCEQNMPSAELLNAVAIHLGREFLNRRVGFLAASGLLNQLMASVGFETAPRTFWDYYIAFENHETSDNPDFTARADVEALVK